MAFGGLRIACGLTPGLLKQPSEPGGFAGTDPGSRKGSNRIFEPGSAPARFEPPDHTRDS